MAPQRRFRLQPHFPLALYIFLIYDRHISGKRLHHPPQHTTIHYSLFTIHYSLFTIH